MTTRCIKLLNFQLQIFNLQEEDFPNLREFNDYLEKVEDIVFRLANELDVENTEAEIKTFREQHIEIIERNKRRPTRDELWIRAMLEEEKVRQRKLQDEHAKDVVSLSNYR
jgi:CDK-activating kinase assembly factor MAT1